MLARCKVVNVERTISTPLICKRAVTVREEVGSRLCADEGLGLECLVKDGLVVQIHVAGFLNVLELPIGKSGGTVQNRLTDVGVVKE